MHALGVLPVFFLAALERVAGIPAYERAVDANMTEDGILAGGGDLLSQLFPVSHESGKSWTTLPSAPGALPLSDATLRPTHVLSSVSHDYVPAPDGQRSMQAIYPKGAYDLTHEPVGGISFYAPGPESIDLTTAKEATFGYRVWFQEGFAFNKGGKLPGLYGGDTEAGSYTCSGGRKSTACFSVRLMWRTNAAGEMYTYLPPYTIPGFEPNKAQCDVPPFSECNPAYGASVGRGAFKFATGQWNTVSERVRLNDAGEANGEIELFVAGRSVIHVDGLILRDGAEGRIRGIQMQTFFGGHTSDWASPKDQKAYFSDFSVAITEPL